MNPVMIFARFLWIIPPAPTELHIELLLVVICCFFFHLFNICQIFARARFGCQILCVCTRASQNSNRAFIFTTRGIGCILGLGETVRVTSVVGARLHKTCSSLSFVGFPVCILNIVQVFKKIVAVKVTAVICGIFGFRKLFFRNKKLISPSFFRFFDVLTLQKCVC